MARKEDSTGDPQEGESLGRSRHTGGGEDLPAFFSLAKELKIAPIEIPSIR